MPRGGGQYLVGHPYTIAGRTYYPSENSALQRRRHGLLVRRRVPRPAHRQRRGLRHALVDARRIRPCRCPATPGSPISPTAIRSSCASTIAAPTHAGRVMDVSSRVADVLDFKSAGTARVKVEYVGPAPLEGSDDDDAARQPAHRRRAGDARRVAGGPTMVAAPTPQHQPRRSRDGRSGAAAAVAERPRDDGAAVVAAAQSQAVEGAAAAGAPVRPGRDRARRSAPVAASAGRRRDGRSSRPRRRARALFRRPRDAGFAGCCAGDPFARLIEPASAARRSARERAEARRARSLICLRSERKNWARAIASRRADEDRPCLLAQFTSRRCDADADRLCRCAGARRRAFRARAASALLVDFESGAVLLREERRRAISRRARWSS